MRPGLKRVSVALQNLSEKTRTFKKGTIIATIKAANLVPPKLAPKYMNENKYNNKKPQPTAECIDKLFSKLDLKGSKQWDSDTQTKLKQVFKDLLHIFVLDDLELGRTDMVKHVIRLDNKIPFCERIPNTPASIRGSQEPFERNARDCCNKKMSESVGKCCHTCLQERWGTRILYRSLET